MASTLRPVLRSCVLWLGVSSLLGGCGDTTPGDVQDSAANPEQDMATMQVIADLSARRDLGPCGGPCSGATPFCDARSGMCVSCRSDGDCPAGQLCRGGACMNGCSAQHPCGDAGSCELDAGVCLECVVDVDCARVGDPMRKVCDGATGRCVGCLPGRDTCGPGTWCNDDGKGGYACVPGCRNDIDCQLADGGGASAACCNHVCVDTATSPKNCGACNVDCMASTCCGGKCLDLQNDPGNCGACGKTCVAPNAVPLCNGAVCSVGGCNMGYSDCNSNPVDGCETNLQGDVGNCGACGKACSIPNASPLCLAGACTIGGCDTGWKNCNGNSNDGCEQDVASDVKNCGTCGNDCGQLPHAMASCKAGLCSVGACTPGYGNCNKNDADGCEAKLDADPSHCGGCGMPCPSPPHVIPSCVNNVCGPGACAPGYVDCNKNMNDGCESQVAVDAMNCGLCGNVCPNGANAVAACAMGQCTFACNGGFLDCNADKNDGCEVDGSKAALHCGKCGNACGNGFVCNAGQCVPAQQWFFANYNGVQNVWNPNIEWNGTISCSKTCQYVNLRAIGVRFICNLHGNGATEGCDKLNDGMVGMANCGKYIDNGVVMNFNGNNEDCAGGQIANCVANQCTENVTYHAIECQCAL